MTNLKPRCKCGDPYARHWGYGTKNPCQDCGNCRDYVPDPNDIVRDEPKPGLFSRLKALFVRT